MGGAAATEMRPADRADKDVMRRSETRFYATGIDIGAMRSTGRLLRNDIIYWTLRYHVN